jgi:hypothetical protein
MWKIVQFSVFAAIVLSNVRYQWTPNPYAASIVALIAVLFISGLPIALAEIWADRKRR